MVIYSTSSGISSVGRRLLAKQKVASSNLVSRSIRGIVMDIPSKREGSEAIKLEDQAKIEPTEEEGETI